MGLEQLKLKKIQGSFDPHRWADQSGIRPRILNEYVFHF